MVNVGIPDLIQNIDFPGTVIFNLCLVVYNISIHFAGEYLSILSDTVVLLAL